jgi:S-DNA-T family DNA segregation ATPase FtsK/SpoIIIE
METITDLSKLSPGQKEILSALVIKLGTLNFSAKFHSLETGPIVLTYILRPSTDSLLSRVLNKSEELSLAIGCESILIKREGYYVHFAIPNSHKTLIKFDSCLHSLTKNSTALEMALPILMGQSTSGEDLVIDLAAQPHLLVAGSTGSGKSVFLSEVICSLAVLLPPERLVLHLVDTKRLDLTLFKNLTHVKSLDTQIDEIHNTLDLLISEVRYRTGILSGKFRNLREYNSQTLRPLPYIVLVLDEYADVVGLDIENGTPPADRIGRKIRALAQISRAVGIHIILATQRPSVKIIDGDIKANFPSRISFKLPTQIDSRVILDEGGAESLLGMGDYLYKTAQSAYLKRGHGAFVALTDIENIIAQHEYIRQALKH